MGGNCVAAAAALFSGGFATAAVCDPDVVTSGATLCTTRNREFSLHLTMIRFCGWVRVFYTGPRRNSGRFSEFVRRNGADVTTAKVTRELGGRFLLQFRGAVASQA